MIAARRLAPRDQLTRLPLPAHDPTIAALTSEERATAAAIWAGRSEAELRAAGSFAYLAGTLADACAPAELVELARRAIHDERRHAQICWQVACAFAGRDLPLPRKLPLRVPQHADARPELERVLHVIGMCCLNETTGNAFLELCRDGARGSLAIAALHELACDEIDHARLGWAFLASPAVSLETRGELAAWLPKLLAENLSAWRERPRRAVSAALVAQGCPSWDAVDAAVLAAISDLLLPGFELIGVDTAAARAWLASS